MFGLPAAIWDGSEARSVREYGAGLVQVQHVPPGLFGSASTPLAGVSVAVIPQEGMTGEKNRRLQVILPRGPTTEVQAVKYDVAQRSRAPQSDKMKRSAMCSPAVGFGDSLS